MLEYLKDPWLWIVCTIVILIIENPIVDWMKF
jgi:hypothetical protein